MRDKITKLVAKTRRKGKRFYKRSLATYKVLYKHYIAPVPWRRTAYTAACLAIFISLLVPILELLPPGWQHSKRYNISPVVGELIGQADSDLSNKITYDSEKKAYLFNKDVMGQDVQTKDGNSITVGGGSKDKAEYGAELPTTAKNGIKIYDSESEQSITLIPQFGTLQGKESQGRVVYPLAGDIHGQKVYTVKKTGLKEDLVIAAPSGNNLSFSYKLDIPNYLEARVTGDSVGIYSTDPSLFGNVSAGTDADQELLQKARENGKKDHLVFMLPAPIIKENGNDQYNPKDSKAHFELNGNILTVKADNLDNLNYPITIDPTVVVTSNTNFQSGGNDDGNTDFDSSGNQISQGTLTGGSIGSWTTNSNDFTTARRAFGAAIYNGRMYLGGGFISASGTSCKNSGSSQYCNDIQYADISSGSLGTWTTNSNYFSSPRRDVTMAIYNGYLYIAGGQDASSKYNDIQYAPIDSNNGSVGTFTTSPNAFGTARYGHNMVASNGHIYIIAGDDASNNPLTSIQYAEIYADGSVGTWGAATTFGTARVFAGATAYNGYIYIISGGTCTGTSLCTGANLTSSVAYSHINSDGSLSTWVATTSFSSARSQHAVTAYKGYIYVTGGYTGFQQDDTRYAGVNADGSLDVWNTDNTTMGNNDEKRNHSALAYNGYLYVLGGWDGSTYYAKIQYAAFNNAGVLANDWSTSASLGTAVRQACGVVYNGYIYAIGGYNDTSANDTNAIQYAAISTSGSIGSWSTTTTLNGQRHSCAAVAYNGQMYVLGGIDWGASVTNTVYYTAINSNGTLVDNGFNNFNSANTFTTARRGLSAFAYNGYMYIAGGTDGSSTFYNDVQKASINSTGSLGTWSSAATFTTARTSFCAAVYGGYIYIVSGQDGTGNSRTSSVYKASVDSSGNVGTFNSTSSVNAARNMAGCGVANGNLYLWGGFDNAGARLTSTERAQVNSDGTLDSWVTMDTLPTAFGECASGNMVYNGFVYCAGGSDNSTATLTTTRYTQINNGGTGGTSSWASSTSFTTARSFTAAATYNGYIYVVGGDSGSGYLSDVQKATINSDGTLGSWSSTSSLNTVRRFHSVVAYNGYLYAILGQDNSTVLSSIEYATINSDGTLGSWAYTTAYPVTRQRVGAFAYNGYMYVIGGDNTTQNKYAPINSNGTLGSWTDTSTLNSIRVSSGVVAYNGYVYAIGGYNWTNNVDSVEYAAINSDGTLGSWAYTASLDKARSSIGAVALNGKIYVFGGSNLGDTATYGDIQVATIGANGQIGGWETSRTGLGVDRKQYGYATYNGYLYVIGGDDNVSRLTTSRYAAQLQQPRKASYSRLVDFNDQSPNYGPNSLGSWSTSGNNFTTARGGNSSVAYNGYLYVAGGRNGASTFLNDVQYAPINGDGSIGSYSSASSFTTGRERFGLAAYNGYMYVFGGCSAGGCSSERTDVQYAQINANGTLGSFSSTTSFNFSGRDCFASLAYNGYLYVLGGTTTGLDAANVAEVRYAPINSNGTVGSWNSTTSFTTARRALAATVYNGYMFISGGANTSGTALSDVQRATVNSNGTVGSWSSTTSLPAATMHHGMVAQNGYLYTIGRYDGSSTFYNTVNMTAVTDTGALEGWRTAASLPAARGLEGVAVWANTIYSTGGWPAVSSDTQTTQYANIQNVGNNVTPSNIVLNGTNTGNSGLGGIGGIDVSYQLANNTCRSLNTANTVNPGNSPLFGSPFNITTGTDCFGLDTQNYRYAWVQFVIDDSQTATYPDPDGNHTTLTDFTIYFSPNAAKRLRGGKTFTNETQNSLDINHR